MPFSRAAIPELREGANHVLERENVLRISNGPQRPVSRFQVVPDLRLFFLQCASVNTEQHFRQIEIAPS